MTEISRPRTISQGQFIATSMATDAPDGCAETKMSVIVTTLKASSTPTSVQAAVQLSLRSTGGRRPGATATRGRTGGGAAGGGSVACMDDCSSPLGRLLAGPARAAN